jgi:hypothetical protein
MAYGGPASLVAEFANHAEEAPVKTVLRRLQQLERCRSDSLIANDASGARERILGKINAMADPRRGDPNWEAAPQPTADQIQQRIQEALSRFRSERVYGD